MKNDLDPKRVIDFSRLKFKLAKSMRYDDVGDYYKHTVVAYDTGNPIMNTAIFIHETIEYILIKSAGIKSELIDLFDNRPESRTEHLEQYLLYRQFHNMAIQIERQFIENLGLAWEEHGRLIDTLKVHTAVNKATEELHGPHPSQEVIEEQTKVVKNTFK